LKWENLIGVPASTHIPGQVITFAGTAAPTGTLLCDGSEVLRADYPRLFAAIGETYGAATDPAKFMLPKVDEDSGIIHTGDPAKVGQTSAGAVISHTHSASASAGGGHAHSASAGAVGDHAHSAWTDGQGYHAHTGGTSWQGDHAHGGVVPSAPAINGYGVYRERDNDALPSDGGTAGAGGHAHSFSTDATGNHTHNIGMNGAGSHSHTISVAAVGDHAHAITVGSTGSARNLPAGIRMLYCIAY
jgi:microcystin-dependent protein